MNARDELDPGEITSVAHLLSAAMAAEHEAVRRYRALAEQMREAGNREVAALFERLMEEERGHEQQLEQWAAEAGVTPDTETRGVQWRHPAVRSDHDAEAVDPARSTPYKALSFAVHNEERAFRFYAYVAAFGRDTRLRDYAERLAHEELAHAALLRSMRRRAWRKERENGDRQPELDVRRIRTVQDLTRAAARIEERLEVLERRAGEDDQALAALRAACDEAFDFYDAVVQRTDDEAMLLEAQRLGKAMLARIRNLPPP